MNNNLTCAQKIIRLVPMIALPLVVGLISAKLTGTSMDSYNVMNQPPLAPPAWLFPVAWTVLYILMGIGSYFLLTTPAETTDKRMSKFTAMFVYFVQLIFNFAWSLIFFNAEHYSFAFIWLMILWIMILIMIWKSYKISHVAALLFIPYLIWCTFAAYLNLMIAILN